MQPYFDPTRRNMKGKNGPYAQISDEYQGYFSELPDIHI
jgi:hypothetical protein